MRIPTLFYLPSQKISSKAYQLVSSVIISQKKTNNYTFQDNLYCFSDIINKTAKQSLHVKKK